MNLIGLNDMWKINFTEFTNQTRRTVMRFPVCLAFLLALTVQLLWYTQIEKGPDALTFCLSVGMLVSLLIHVTTEDQKEDELFGKPLGIKTLSLWVVSLGLVGADSYALHVIDVTDSVFIAQGAAIVALLVLLVTLPFWKNKDDRECWNFTFRLLTGAAIGELVGLLMMAGLMILYYGTMSLFGYESSVKTYFSIVIVCTITIAVILFLIRIPEGQQKHDQQNHRNRFFTGVIRYLFLPLVILYLAVLYTYGLKIVFTLTLPQGMLSTLVSIMMVGIIGITCMLYPNFLDEEHHGFEIRMTRICQLLSLPLLVLMSVGIIRRLMDYGYSANRMYMLTLNIWFYVVAIGLILKHVRRIHWVGISFAAVLMATSCHPWNYYKIYSWILVSRCDDMMKKYHIPVDTRGDKAINRVMSKMTRDDVVQFRESLIALNQCDSKMLETKYGNVDVYRLALVNNLKPEFDHWKAWDMEYQYSKPVSIPQGYRYIENADYGTSLTCKDDSSMKSYESAIGYRCTEDHFVLKVKDGEEYVVAYGNLTDSKPYQVRSKSGKSLIAITNLGVDDAKGDHSEMRLNMNGYRFMK